jgi:bile acid:Na+ symporter, BASS family
MAGVVVRVLLITVIPLAFGMWLRARSPERVIEIEPRVKRIALIVFVAVVVGAIVAENERVLDNLGEVALAAITLNIAAMSVSFGIARIAGLDDRQTTAIAIELGVHNATLAIAIGASISAVLTIPAAVYSAFMFITAGLFARMMYRRNSAEPLAQTA